MTRFHVHLEPSSLRKTSLLKMYICISPKRPVSRQNGPYLAKTARNSPKVGLLKRKIKLDISKRRETVSYVMVFSRLAHLAEVFLHSCRETDLELAKFDEKTIRRNIFPRGIRIWARKCLKTSVSRVLKRNMKKYVMKKQKFAGNRSRSGHFGR